MNKEQQFDILLNLLVFKEMLISRKEILVYEYAKYIRRQFSTCFELETLASNDLYNELLTFNNDDVENIQFLLDESINQLYSKLKIEPFY